MAGQGLDEDDGNLLFGKLLADLGSLDYQVITGADGRRGASHQNDATQERAQENGGFHGD